VVEKEHNNRTRTVLCRLTATEYKLLEKMWKSSTSGKLSDYMRRKLFDKEIVTTYRNSSLDEFMGEMIQLRKELNGLANNFNQVVKKLHVLNQTQDLVRLLVSYQLEQKILMNKVDDVKKNINKMADIWLQ